MCIRRTRNVECTIRTNVIPSVFQFPAVQHLKIATPFIRTNALLFSSPVRSGEVGKKNTLHGYVALFVNKMLIVIALTHVRCVSCNGTVTSTSELHASRNGFFLLSFSIV